MNNHLTNDLTLEQVADLVRQWETDGCAIMNVHPSAIPKQLLATMQREKRLRIILQDVLDGNGQVDGETLDTIEAELWNEVSDAT